jgi:hypothetical protein
MTLLLLVRLGVSKALVPIFPAGFTFYTNVVRNGLLSTRRSQGTYLGVLLNISSFAFGKSDT